MAVEKFVLVVSPTPTVAQAIASSVRRCGYTPVVVKGFAEAKKQMEVAPHLLVTELKLAEYNGLHLALRAQTNDVPAIVIADPSFEREVEQVGATWLPAESSLTDELSATMTRMVQGVSEPALGWMEGVRDRATGPFTWRPDLSVRH